MSDWRRAGPLEPCVSHFSCVTERLRAEAPAAPPLPVFRSGPSVGTTGFQDPLDLDGVLLVEPPDDFAGTLASLSISPHPEDDVAPLRSTSRWRDGEDLLSMWSDALVENDDQCSRSRPHLSGQAAFSPAAQRAMEATARLAGSPHEERRGNRDRASAETNRPRQTDVFLAPRLGSPLVPAAPQTTFANIGDAWLPSTVREQGVQCDSRRAELANAATGGQAAGSVTPFPPEWWELSVADGDEVRSQLTSASHVPEEEPGDDVEAVPLGGYSTLGPQSATPQHIHRDTGLSLSVPRLGFAQESTARRAAGTQTATGATSWLGGELAAHESSRSCRRGGLPGTTATTAYASSSRHCRVPDSVPQRDARQPCNFEPPACSRLTASIQTREDECWLRCETSGGEFDESHGATTPGPLRSQSAATAEALRQQARQPSVPHHAANRSQRKSAAAGAIGGLSKPPSPLIEPQAAAAADLLAGWRSASARGASVERDAALTPGDYIQRPSGSCQAAEVMHANSTLAWGTSGRTSAVSSQAGGAACSQERRRPVERDRSLPGHGASAAQDATMAERVALVKSSAEAALAAEAASLRLENALLRERLQLAKSCREASVSPRSRSQSPRCRLLDQASETAAAAAAPSRKPGSLLGAVEAAHTPVGSGRASPLSVAVGGRGSCARSASPAAVSPQPGKVREATPTKEKARGVAPAAAPSTSAQRTRSTSWWVSAGPRSASREPASRKTPARSGAQRPLKRSASASAGASSAAPPGAGVGCLLASSLGGETGHSGCRRLQLGTRSHHTIHRSSSSGATTMVRSCGCGCGGYTPKMMTATSTCSSAGRCRSPGRPSGSCCRSHGGRPVCGLCRSLRRA
eukprot:TRINITY_DN63159_c0_g1_i16.p1 TRINITY_DN63159_c0_g1~~TRINITY_DN63159_c0_g1_i16.p1  ORF type:complete len:865 (+),score=117.84 TRINITY_DN63159_c0_g1_i16:78-2672(+)